jgi:hypothetical protein
MAPTTPVVLLNAVEEEEEEEGEGEEEEEEVEEEAVVAMVFKCVGS